MILAMFCPCPSMMMIVVTYNRNIVNLPRLLHKGDNLVNISIGDLWSTVLVDNTVYNFQTSFKLTISFIDH